MPRSLTSRWFRIAKSGPTIDGRQISKQEIKDMADTYDLDVYTANIFPEHIRNIGTLGTVHSLEYREEDDGELGLYARLRPNDAFLSLNDQAQLLFGSAEISPNFLNKGKAYFTGLGATDTPASTGCQEFYFSTRPRTTPFSYLIRQRESLPRNQDFFSDPQKGFFNALKNLFHSFGMTQTHLTQLTKEFNMVDITLTEEQLGALQAIYQTQVANTNALGDFIVALNGGDIPDTTPAQDDAATQVEVAVAEIVEEVKEAKKDNEEFKSQVLGAIKNLTNQFSQLANSTPTTRSFNRTGAVVDKTTVVGKGKGAL